MEMMDEKTLRILGKRGRVTIVNEVEKNQNDSFQLDGATDVAPLVENWPLPVLNFINYIPQEVRDAIGMARGDVVSFAVISEDAAIVKRERLCDNCVQCSSGLWPDEIAEPPQMINLLVQAMHLAEDSPASQKAFEFLTDLSPTQQYDHVVKIIAEWAGRAHD